MADLKSYGNRLNGGLTKAVSITGPIAGDNLAKIRRDLLRLEDSLKLYDRHLEVLLRELPDSQDLKEDIDQRIRSRYPEGRGYTDKRYKMMFLRTVQRVKDVFSDQQGNKRKEFEASKESLTSFKLTFNIVVVATRRLLQVAASVAEAVPAAEQDPEDYDTELSGVIEGLDEELQDPAALTDKHQKQTETNLQRKTRNVEPTGKASSEEEYRSLVGRYTSIVEGPKTVVRQQADSLSSSLKRSDRQTFSLISRSARYATELAKSFGLAATSGRAEMYPGTYSACKAFADVIVEINRSVIEAGPANRQQSNKMRSRDKAYEQYLKSTEVPS